MKFQKQTAKKNRKISISCWLNHHFPKVSPGCLYDERMVNLHCGQAFPDFTRQVQFQGEEGIDAGGVAKAGIEHEDGPICLGETMKNSWDMLGCVFYVFLVVISLSYIYILYYLTPWPI